MKRTIIIILGLATAYCGWCLQAQPPATTPSAPPPPPLTKVGVVNMVHVYSNCKRAKDLKTQIENELKPVKVEQDKLAKLITDWQNALKTNANLKPAERDQGGQVIKECRRRLEDIDLKIKMEMFPRLEKDTQALTKYIDDVVKAYSAQNGFHLVVAFGEPETPLSPAMAFQRTITSIDQGMVRPVFFPGGIDITQELLTLLNSR